MEFSMIELMDALPEVNVDIQENPSASVKRIKELTMKKIHAENNSKRRSLSGFTKVLLAAAVIASLAIPVMAATGFQFTDWLAGLFQPGESYDSNLALGSDSKSWEMSGWVIELAAENVSGEGLTVVCGHHTNEAQPQSGTLETDEGYWIEIWNGSGYDALPAPQNAVPGGKVLPIQADTTAEWTVNWADTYGPLAPGSYRLGKNFTYTAEDGTQEKVVNYVKFRVFSQDMAPVITQCRALVEDLRTKDSYHIAETGYPEMVEYDHYTMNYWKHGEDYLVERRYVMEDGSLSQHDGYLYRNGKGYALTWEGDAVLSAPASWERVDWLDETQRNMWSLALEIYDSNVGEVAVDGNGIKLVSGLAIGDGQERFTELRFTKNEQGELAFAQLGAVPGMEYSAGDVEVSATVEVQDTAEKEIAEVIASLKVDS